MVEQIKQIADRFRPSCGACWIIFVKEHAVQRSWLKTRFIGTDYDGYTVEASFYCDDATNTYDFYKKNNLWKRYKSYYYGTIIVFDDGHFTFEPAGPEAWG